MKKTIKTKNNKQKKTYKLRSIKNFLNRFELKKKTDL